MSILYFLACVFRPICLPLPEMLIITFGQKYSSSIDTLLLGVIGSAIGIAGMYLIAYFSSEKLINTFHLRDKLSKFQVYIDRYSTGIIGVFFVLPVFPDIIIGLGAAVLKVRLPEYIFLAILSKTISIGMIVYAKEIAQILTLENWQILLIEFLLMQILAILFQRIDKFREKKLLPEH